MEKISNKIFKAKVLESEIIAEGVKKITFKLSDPFEFLAWQYVWVEIPKLKNDDAKGNRRAFSILSIINEENTIEIVARTSESGYKKSLFSLDKEDDVIIHGPFGYSFIIDENHQPKNIIMIAGGVGIAAFLPMVETIKNKSYPVNVYLVYLNKNKETTPFLKELDELENSTNFFDYTSKYENFSWEDVGSIADKMSGGIEWWIAGSQQMVNHVYKILEGAGISGINMIFENFYPTIENNLTHEFVLSQMVEANIFAKAIQNTTNHVVITDRGGGSALCK